MKHSFWRPNSVVHGYHPERKLLSETGMGKTWRFMQFWSQDGGRYRKILETVGDTSRQHHIRAFDCYQFWLTWMNRNNHNAPLTHHFHVFRFPVLWSPLCKSYHTVRSPDFTDVKRKRYLLSTLPMGTLFRGWPVMVNDTHTRRRRRLSHNKTTNQSVIQWWNLGSCQWRRDKPI